MSIHQKAPSSAFAFCWQRYRYWSALSMVLAAATAGAAGCGGAEPDATADRSADAGPAPAAAQAESVSEQLSAAVPPAAACPAGTNLLGQYATWCGKVNVHTQGTAWVSDSDCSSGCNIHTVNYCQKFWPGATVQQVLPAPTSDLKPFKTGGCANTYPSIGHAQYACCAPPVLPTTECLMITGWTTMPWGAEKANLAVADCTVIPQGTAWTEITKSYAGPVSPRRWVRIPLNDPHMTGWRLHNDRYLVLESLNTTPVIWHDLIPSVPSAPGQQFYPYPPKQGIPQVGTVARLRAVNRGGNCMRGSSANGATVNWTCDDSTSLNYVFDDAGSGNYRLRHKQYNQCLWTHQDYVALPLENRPCAPDLDMAFAPIAVPGGYLLQQVDDELCPLGYWAHGDAVRAYGCSPTDPAMAWAVDIIQY